MQINKIEEAPSFGEFAVSAAGVEQFETDAPELTSFWGGVYAEYVKAEKENKYWHRTMLILMNRAWRLHINKIEELSLRPITTPQAKGDDPRLAALWLTLEGAARNYAACSTFEDLTIGLGGPRRAGHQPDDPYLAYKKRQNWITRRNRET